MVRAFAKRVGDRLRCLHEVIKNILGIGDQSDARDWRNRLEHRQPFAGDARFDAKKAGQIAARPVQARRESRADWVGDPDKDDWDGRSILGNKFIKAKFSSYDHHMQAARPI